MLPPDQNDHFNALRLEFETARTPEARFARALDALQPTWLHWGEHAAPTPENMEASRILVKKRGALEAFPTLWDYLQRIIESAVERGILQRNNSIS